MEKKEINKIIKILKDTYPLAKPALEFSNSFELLIAVILSAQCTDVRVNKVTEKLFEKFKTPEDFASLQEAELYEQIKSCGLGASKAKGIIATSKILVKDFGSQVPSDLKVLQSLPQVGRKTANVVASVAFNVPAIAVDTHVFRVSNRIGLAKSKNVLSTEKDLMNNIEKKDWSLSHHLLIFHGRNICKAQNPKCGECPLENHCNYFNSIQIK